MSVKKTKKRARRVSRRNVLRGMVGGSLVTVGLPIFDSMFNENGTALADGGAIPRRFGIFFWGNGVIPERWTPPTTGAGYELSEQLASLAPVRDWVSVITGMRVRTGNERGHHAGTVGILSGSPMISQDPMGAGYASTFSAPSIDQVIADALPRETRFPSIEYGVHDGAPGSEGTTLKYLSHNGPDNVNPPEYSPRALFDRIFGEGFTPPGETPPVDPRLALRRSVLDAVLEDANSLRARLGTSDRARLDQHMAGIRDLELQIAMLEELTPPPYLAACEEPTEVPGDPGGDLRERNRLMAQVMAMALACDQTRVFSNMFSGSVSNTRYPGTSGGHHSQTHDEGDPWADVHVATLYITECFSDMIAAFRDIPEGDGVLLDHMAVLGSTDLSWDHGLDDYPILVAGGACGYLRTPGVHYRSSSAENTSKVLLTMMRAAGVDAADFGNGGGYVTESCTEIES